MTALNHLTRVRRNRARTRGLRTWIPKVKGESNVENEAEESRWRGGGGGERERNRLKNEHGAGRPTEWNSGASRTDSYISTARGASSELLIILIIRLSGIESPTS